MTQTQNRQGCETDKVKRVAQEIERYLATRSGSADTVKGIVHWWLMQQRIVETERLVEQAIMSLCEQGKLEKRSLPDGTDLFIAVQKT